MPNWCDNMVTLRHTDKSKIDALDAELSKKSEGHYGSQGQLLNFLRPNPTGEWQYDWSVDNWGTKWDASIIDWERRDDNEIWVSFESAWSPPTRLYDYIVEEGWEVEAIYQESGMGYAGQYTTDGGDDYFEYDITDPDSIENLPEDIIEFGELRTRAQDYQDEMQAEEEHQEYLMTVTDWYPVEVNPARIGEYEVTEAGSPNWPFYKKVLWDGKKWTLDGKKYKVGTWRGLNSDPEAV